jgi:hypothetical protein
MTTAPIGCLDEREVAALVEELDNASGRLTQHTNNPLDGLLNAAARMIESLVEDRLRSASRQEGWQLVPTTPTDAMTFAGQQARYPATNSITVIYRAMLAAAPQQAQEAQGDRHGE